MPVHPVRGRRVRAVFVTQFNGQPSGNLVACAVNEDLRGLLYATVRETHENRRIAAKK